MADCQPATYPESDVLSAEEKEKGHPAMA